MTRINLLPWRDEARKRRRIEFLIAAGVTMAITLLAAVGVHVYIEGRITAQLEINRLLETEISLLNRQIKEIDELDKIKSDLLSRMDVIQQLQVSRPEIVKMFDALVTAMPDGVYLTRLDQTGRAIVVEGRARSNAGVSAFMRAIESSRWIGNPRLLLIENKDQTGTGLSHFRLGFEQVTPAGDQEPSQRARPGSKRTSARTNQRRKQSQSGAHPWI